MDLGLVIQYCLINRGLVFIYLFHLLIFFIYYYYDISSMKARTVKYVYGEVHNMVPDVIH